MTGADATRKVEGLDVTMSLEDAQVEALKKVDAWVKAEAFKNCKLWFTAARS